MASTSIVEALDVVEHVGLGLLPCPVDTASDPLPLEQREEALDRCVVVAATAGTHAALDAVPGQQIAEVVTGVLRSTIGMVRLHTKETSNELARIFEEIRSKSRTREPLSEDFSSSAQDKLDDIFQD